MRGADGDKHAGLSNLEAAKAVDDSYTMDAILFAELSGNFAHFGKRHGLVGFVVKVKRRAIVGLVADETVEGHDGAVLGGAHMVDQGPRINRLANELEDVIVTRRGHSFASATADGREESDFVARMEHSIPGSEFLIAGSYHGRAVFTKLRNSLGI